MDTRGTKTWALGATATLAAALTHCTPPPPASGQQIICDCTGRMPEGAAEVTLPDGTPTPAGAAEARTEAWRIARCAPSYAQSPAEQCALECAASRPRDTHVRVAGASILPGAQSCEAARPIVAEQSAREASAAGFVVTGQSSVTLRSAEGSATLRPQGEVWITGGRCAAGETCPVQIRWLMLRVPRFDLAGRPVKNLTVQANGYWEGVRKPDGSITLHDPPSVLITGYVDKQRINVVHTLGQAPALSLALGPGTDNTMTAHLATSTVESPITAEVALHVALPEGAPEVRVAAYIDPTDNRVVLDGSGSLNARGAPEQFAQYRWIVRHGDATQAEVASGAVVKLPRMPGGAIGPFCLEVQTPRGFTGVGCLSDALVEALYTQATAIERRRFAELPGAQVAGCGSALRHIAGATRFARMVHAAGLEPLIDSGRYTVLAPRDSVLAADPAAEAALLEPRNAAALHDYVMSHLVPRYGVTGRELAEVLSATPLASGRLLDAQPAGLPGADADISCDRAEGVVHMVDEDPVSMPASSETMTAWRPFTPAPEPICL